MIVLITYDFQDTEPFQQTPFCTDRVRKSRIESCFARLESDMVRHRVPCPQKQTGSNNSCFPC